MNKEEFTRYYLSINPPRPDILTEIDEIFALKTQKELDYLKWEQETLSYAPDYYTIENDYDDNHDLF